MNEEKGKTALMRQTALCLTLVIVGTACGPREIHVTMNSDNNSGQSGFAVITDRGAKGVTVYVETSAPEFVAKQNAHFHNGDCGEVGMKRGTLEGLVALANKTERAGSTTELGSISFAILATDSLIINVHDARDEGVYVSCGEVPRP